MKPSDKVKQRVVEQAVELALKFGWANFSLLELAKQSGYSLSELSACFRSKDDIAEALFDRADGAMLKLAEDSSFTAKDPQARTVHCIMVWLNTLEPVKPLIKSILCYKLEPGHFHLQAHGITRISRTVQWIREISARPQHGFAQIVDEIALTSAYLASFYFYLNDTSKDNTHTHDFVLRQIGRIEQAQLGCAAKNPFSHIKCVKPDKNDPGAI